MGQEKMCKKSDGHVEKRMCYYNHITSWCISCHACLTWWYSEIKSLERYLDIMYEIGEWKSSGRYTNNLISKANLK